MRARGPDIHYRLEVDFLDAANGAKRRITSQDVSSRIDARAILLYNDCTV